MSPRQPSTKPSPKRSIESDSSAIDLEKTIRALRDELESNRHLKVKSIKMPPRMTKRHVARIASLSPQSLFALHQELNGLTVEWEPKKKVDPDVKGVIKILTVDEILRDWKGVVYFDFTPDEDPIRTFRPIDFFIDEAAAGGFIGESKDESLYLFSFEGEPTNLHLDMVGYVRMAVASKGFLYWHYAVAEILEGQENPVSRRFKEWMPRLFEGFRWDAYVALYNELRR